MFALNILKDFKNAQFLTDCISGTTACRDNIFSYRKPAASFSLRYDVQLGEEKKTCICRRNFDVNGLNENLDTSQIYGVSMIKRIQTSCCCDFAGFKTCKKKYEKMQLTHQ